MRPTLLPLFPLHTVLFPGGELPLQIFEVRYLNLIKRCAQSGEPFGIVCLQSGHEVRRAPQVGQLDNNRPEETFAQVGTLASLTQIRHPQPGLLLITVRGGQRFHIDRTEMLPHGLWMGHVSWLPDDLPSPLPIEHARLPNRLRAVMQAMADDGLAPGPTLPSLQDTCWQEAGWLANRWAERLPLPAVERQRLMSLDNPAWRLDLVAEWLDKLPLGPPVQPQA